jgi:hypothetical protein
MKHGIALLKAIIMAVLLGSCNNFFHDLIPPDDTLILSFEVEGQLGGAVISGDTVTVTVAKGTDLGALVPAVRVSGKATLLPVTPGYVGAAFPNADLAEATAQMNRSNDRSRYVMDLIRENPDFNAPPVTMPIDFSGPVAMLVVGGMGSIRQYMVYVVEDTGEPRLLAMRFAKYDNPELISDAVCVVDEAGAAVYANAVYPAEMDYLSYALIPSFSMLGDGFEADGNRIVSGVGAVRFSPSLGAQSKTITITRDGISKNYALIVVFTEDADSVRSITDFRFNKTDNGGISANAVGSIINTDNTGAITVQVYYSGAKPARLTPGFISPGTVSVGGVTQISGANSHDFSSPVEYRVVSRNGMYTRIYRVKVEFIDISGAAPRITAFRFSAALNGELVQDTQGQIIEGTIYIDARYGGDSVPEKITPEFSAQGIVTVSGSVQVSGASAQDFAQPVKYTVTNPENPNLSRDYWVRCAMIQDASSYAAITSFGFYPEDNPGFANEMTGRIDQINGMITVYAPAGSGATGRMMIPRFTASGQVNVKGTAQVSGVSGRMFDAPVTYTVVSANGRNRREYAVSVREPKSPIYVNRNAYGFGDGSSWKDAFTNLKEACEAVAEFPEAMTKEIWIAAGTYTPGRTPEEYFPVTANTKYIGGFAGWETDKGQRNIAANTVTISGDLGGGVKADYLFRVNSSGFNFNDEEMIGDFFFENLHLKNVGVGIELPNLSGNVEINNLDLQDIDAVGIYCRSRHLFNMRASNITAKNIGGRPIFCLPGFYSSETGQAEFILKDSYFENVSDGLYIRFLNEDARTSIELSNVSINMIDYFLYGYYSNFALTIEADKIDIDRVNIDGGTKAGGIEIASKDTVKISNSNIRNCIDTSWVSGMDYGDYVIGEYGWEGAGVYINCKGTTEISNTVIENVEACIGAGIYYSYSNRHDSSGDKGNGGDSLTLRNVTIKNAKAIYAPSAGNPCGYGGGLYFYSNGKLNIIDTVMENCQSEVNNGAIYTYSSNNTITNSRFIGCSSPGGYPVLQANRFNSGGYTIMP